MPANNLATVRVAQRHTGVQDLPLASSAVSFVQLAAPASTWTVR